MDPETGEVERWASEVVKELGSYTELSLSGTGLRIIAHGELPPGRRKRGDVEMYDRDHYLTITGYICFGQATISPEDRTARGTTSRGRRRRRPAEVYAARG